MMYFLTLKVKMRRRKTIKVKIVGMKTVKGKSINRMTTKIRTTLNFLNLLFSHVLESALLIFQEKQNERHKFNLN